MAETQHLNIGDYVKVERIEGIACRFIAHPLIFDDTCVLCEYAEHAGDDACRDYEMAIVRMVGDDRDITVSMTELTPILATEFCRDCGQMGCTSNVYE